MRISNKSWLVLSLSIAYLATASLVGYAEENKWTDLFNGKDLTGWETWLRATEADGGKEGEPIGLNNDPYNVFTVQNGKIRISGEVFGCISSVEEFSDYQIRFDFKWGEKKWPPRLNQLRDSGFLYHAHGPHGGFWNAWKASMEYQVQEGDVGDIFPLMVPRPKSLIPKEMEGNPEAMYDAEQEPTNTSWRVKHSGKHEFPNGEWNTCQVIVSGDHSAHIVNGFVVNRVIDMKNKGNEPLTSGHVQFQSEAAEVFYKNIKIRDLPEKGESDASLLAGLNAEQASVEVGEKNIQLVYKNSGSVLCDVPAVEILGAAANDFHVELPEMPAMIAPGESLQINVHYHASEKSSESAQATLRLEGLDGPAEHTRIALNGSN